MVNKRIKIEYIKINTITPWDKNPKLHDMDSIIKSMDTFSITQPILIQKSSDRVIAGHGRLEAMKTLGMDSVPVVRLDLTDEEAKAYALVDNQTVMAAGWDEELLCELLGDIKIELPDIDMSDFGFDLGDYELDIDVTEDEVPEPQKVAKSKLGEVYKLGNHRLMCGDATSKEDVATLMDGKKANSCVTDPPYNVGIDYDNNKSDEQCDTEYKIFSSEWFKLARSISDVVVFTPGRGKKLKNIHMWFEIEKPLDMAIWVKKNSPTHGSLSHFMAWEPILVYGDPPKRTSQDVYDYPIINQYSEGTPLTDLHPTPKRLELWSNLITDFTITDGNVYEPFGGSGTTIISCEKTNRHCYMMELAPIYIDAIITRWQNLTGKKAVLIK